MANTETITNNTGSPTVTASAALWRIALNEYEQAKADYAALDAKLAEQTAAYYAERGEPNPDFDKYRVGAYVHFQAEGFEFPSGRTDEQQRIFLLATNIVATDYAGDAKIDAEEYGAIMRRAATIAGEYVAFRARQDEIHERTIGTVEKQWEAALDGYNTAKHKLIDTPAPDADAMLLKLAILETDMVEGEAEFDTEIIRIHADARRLFGSK